MGFNYLDDESEKVLKELLETKEFYDSPSFMVPGQYSISVIQNLLDLGYLESSRGIVYLLPSGHYCSARLTQAAKTYDEMKAIHERNQSKYYSSQTNYNFPNAIIINSALQLGNIDSTQNFDFEYVEKTVNELEVEIEKAQLSYEQKKEILEMVEDIKEKNKKKSNLVKRALKNLLDFTKEIGCAVLSNFLIAKFGITG